MLANVHSQQSRYLHTLDAIDCCEDDDLRAGLVADAEAILEGLAEDEPAKLDLYRWIHVRLMGEAATCRAEEKRLADVRRKREAWADRLKARAFALLEGIEARSGAATLKTATASYRLQMGPKRIEGPAGVDAWAAQGWIRVTESPDKAAAKDGLTSLDAGDWPDGFAIVRSRSVRW